MSAHTVTAIGNGKPTRAEVLQMRQHERLQHVHTQTQARQLGLEGVAGVGGVLDFVGTKEEVAERTETFRGITPFWLHGVRSLAHSVA